MLASFAYILGFIVTLACCILLLRGYKRVHNRLLLWSGFCFFGLALSNLLVFLDMRVFLRINLYPLRLIVAALSMIVLLFGLIWEGGQ
jgi:hypothetical protein